MPAAAVPGAPEPDLAGLAQDLHDAVTHRLTTMVVQADAAQTRLAGRSPETAAALAAIASSGRAALAELRDLLTRLEADAAPDRPGDQPGLAHLPRLLELAGARGRRPALRVVGEPRPLPAPVQLAIYRTVQESVTNTLRHSPASTATVTIRYGRGVVEVQVDSEPAAPSRVAGPRLGWLGMLRRAAALGGGLVAGPRPGRGYRVLVRLPDPGPA
jgi:signal transduction histidine kinase